MFTKQASINREAQTLKQFQSIDKRIQDATDKINKIEQFIQPKTDIPLKITIDHKA